MGATGVGERTDGGVGRLPGAVLAEIFSMLPFDERRHVIPRVCKHWDAVSRSSPQVWRSCTLNGRDLVKGGPTKVDWRHVLSWFVDRSTGVELLQIWRVDFRATHMPALLPMLLALLCKSLESVHLGLCHFGCDAWDGLLCLRGLKQLKIQLSRSLPSWKPVARLSSLKNLEILDVGFNTWPKGNESRIAGEPMVIDFPQRLIELRLASWGCVSAVLPPDAFENWGDVELIDLSGTELQSLPPSASTLTSLCTLSINSDRILESFTMLTSLKTVAIERPTSVELLSGMTWIESLCLHCMKACEVELQGLSGLFALTSLLLGSCGLRSVPDVVAGLSTLKELSLWGNSISSLPRGQYLTALKMLHLTKNDFVEMPDVLAEATELVRLDMRDNNFLKISDRAVDLVLGMRQLEALTWGGDDMVWSQGSARNMIRLAEEKSDRLSILM
eukprot:evm.model.scf_1109.1 EVM.evm.TU.scf_1109.1   scf_1109:4418-7816(-)